MRALTRLQRRLSRWSDRRRPAILLYHRVARLDCDPWGLAVAPDLFAEQIEAMMRRRRVVPLERLAEELGRGRAPANWVAITFDDGYADVLGEACPVLKRLSCPATLFVTTGALDGEGFWWDRLSEAILTPAKLPQRLELDGAEGAFRWEAGAVDGAERERLHLALWRRLRGLDPERRGAELTRIEAWAGVADRDLSRDRPLTTCELIELAASGVVSIGAHGASHAPLPELKRFEKAAEIAGSRRRCEEILGRPVVSFAYPFGELDAECREEVRRAGFRLACSTVPGPVRRDSARFALPRVTVGAWSGEELLRRLPWGG